MQDLFPDFRDVEKEFYKETNIFPIMHLVVIRQSIYEKNRWIASSFYKAFVDAKNWALKRMRFSAAQCYMLPWQFADLDEIDEIFEGDPWPYGIEANRPTLVALVQYMVEQNFIAQPIRIENLFVPLPGAISS